MDNDLNVNQSRGRNNLILSEDMKSRLKKSIDSIKQKASKII